MFDGLFNAIGSVIGGAIQAEGARETNAANIAFGRETMDFQERMSSTAHRREVEDLRAAGLNPILSAKFGGASTPAGTSVTQVNPYADAGARGAASALALTRGQAEVDLLEAQAEQAKASATRERTQASLNNAMEFKTGQETQNLTQENERVGRFMEPWMVKLLADTEGVREHTLKTSLENRILPHHEVSARRVANEDALIDAFRKAPLGQFLLRLRTGGEDIRPLSQSVGSVMSGVGVGAAVRELLRRVDGPRVSRPRR